MKTLYIFPLVISILFCQSLTAQVSYKFGIGPNWSNNNHSVLDYEFRTGVSADARIVIRAEKKLQLEIGLAYNQKGSSKTSLFSDFRWPEQHDGNGNFDPSIPANTDEIYPGLSGFRFKHIASYVEAPLQASFFFCEADKGLYVLGSFRPGFSFRHSYKNIEILNNGKKGEVDSDPNFGRIPRPKRFNILARAGLGFELNTSGINYFTEAYFEHQLINMAENPVLKSTLYQYGMGVLVGVKF